MKKLYAAFVSALFWLPVLEAQTSEKKIASLEEAREEIRKAHLEMREELEKMGLQKTSSLIDSAFYHFDFDRLGEDDRFELPELDERSLADVFDEMESQLEQIEGIDTSAMNDLMEFFWKKMRALPAEFDKPSEQPAVKKRKTSTL